MKKMFEDSRFKKSGMLLAVRMVLTKLPFGPRFPGKPIGPGAPYMMGKVLYAIYFEK